MTKHFAVIGHPINHSRSPQIHEAGFQELEIDATFKAIDIQPEELKDFMTRVRAQEFNGVCVTAPHKEAIRQYLDMETEAVQKIGAVNTVYWENDRLCPAPDGARLCGTNTDGVGALRAIHTVINPAEKNVLLLGAGGAARAITYALLADGANVVIYNRTLEKAKALADQFGCLAVEDLDKVDPLQIHLVVNATTVGLKEWKSPLPSEFWQAGQVGFDAVYDPLETRFLSECQDAGGAIVTGDKMLIHQALEQFRIWHGVELEAEVMERAFFVE